MFGNTQKTINIDSLRLTNPLLEELLILWLKSHQRTEWKGDRNEERWEFSLTDYLKYQGPDLWFALHSVCELYRFEDLSDIRALTRAFTTVYFVRISQEEFNRLYEVPARIMARGQAAEAEDQRQAEEARLAALPPRPENVTLESLGVSTRGMQDAGITTAYDALTLTKGQMMVRTGNSATRIDRMTKKLLALGFKMDGDPNWPVEAIPQERLTGVRPQSARSGYHGDEPYLTDAEHSASGDDSDLTDPLEDDEDQPLGGTRPSSKRCSQRCWELQG